MSDSGAWQPSPDIGINPFTQELGKEKKKFEQFPLMKSEHEDGALHLVGGALPVPSDSQVTRVGRGNSAGASPIIARADHKHDSAVRWGIFFAQNYQAVPGQTFINNWQWSAGEDYRVGGQQVFQFPQEGVWLINGVFEVVTVVPGGNFSGQLELKSFFFNGTYSRPAWNQRIAGATTHPNVSFTFTDIPAFSSVNATTNIQFAWLQNDVVDHYVTCHTLELIRLGSNAVAN